MHEMLDWNKQPDQPTQDDALPHEGPYPAPDRPCYICGQQEWHWNAEKEQYECASASGTPTHAARTLWLKETFPEEPFPEG